MRRFLIGRTQQRISRQRVFLVQPLAAEKALPLSVPPIAPPAQLQRAWLRQPVARRPRGWASWLQVLPEIGRAHV